MFPGIDYIKTIVNGISSAVASLLKEMGTKLSKEIDKKIEVSKADWNQNDETQPGYVKNRPMYSYKENIGTKYSVSDISSNPFPLVLGEEWYVMGTYLTMDYQYLPEGTKAILVVGENSSGDLCIASDSYEFNTGSEASSRNRFIIYADHIYQLSGWKSAEGADVMYAYRLAEPYYETAYKTIDASFLPMANKEAPGIVNPYFIDKAIGTEVTVNEKGKLYCQTRMPIVYIRSGTAVTPEIKLDFKGDTQVVFLLFYNSNNATSAIKINGIEYNVYINGASSVIPSNSDTLLLAVADSNERRVYLVKNPIS